MHTMVHDQLARFYNGFRRDAHPMAVMVGVVGALSAFYHDSLDINDPEHREISSMRLIAKVPTIAAMAYKYNTGYPFMFPKNKFSYVENFMFMMFATPAEDLYVPNPLLVRALERIFILHADHEQNASTATVRLAGSSGANPFACLGAGIASLWGPAHGGANEAVINMLLEIGTKDKLPEFIQGVKDKKRRLMGFGHRVYKNYDPRAAVLRKACHEVLVELKRVRPTSRCSASQWNWSELRWRINTSSSANCIRTWISIPASFTARSTSRRRCSHRCSPSPAPWAGWRNGKRWSRTPNRKSGGRASCTGVRPSVITCRWGNVEQACQFHAVDAGQLASVRSQCAFCRGAVRAISR